MRRTAIGIAAILALATAASEALARQDQVITFSSAATTGSWGQNGCGTGNERGINTGGATLTLTWNDTTGAVGDVQVEIQAAWKFFGVGGAYTVSVNGANAGNGTAPTVASQQCNATPYETTTQVIGPGAFTFNTDGPNSVTFTHSGTNWIGVMDNAQGWAVRIAVTVLNVGPAIPLNPTQIGPDGKTVPVGGLCPSSTIRLRATVFDQDNDDVFLEAEVQPTSVFFVGTPNFTGSPAPSGQDAIVDATGLALGGYHWQVRAVDPFDVQSGWISFGGNSEILADFRIDPAGLVPPPVDTARHGDCGNSTGSRGSGLSLVALVVLLAAAATYASLSSQRRRALESPPAP